MTNENEKSDLKKAYKKAYNAKPEVKAKKKARDAERIMCEICCCMTTRGSKSKHQKSRKCQKFLDLYHHKQKFQ